MTLASPTAAALLDDAAVYKRTALGQRALQFRDDRPMAPELKVLARLNGFTELRRLIDLAPGDALLIAHTIPALYEQRLIERVDPAH